MTKETQRPVAIVTGGSSGIGRATAMRLAREGCHPFIVARNLEKLTEVAAEIHDFGAPCNAISWDLNRDAAEAGEIADHVVEEAGRIDILINNAASAPLAPFAETSSEKFETLVNVNVRATHFLTQRTWQYMRNQHSNDPAFQGTIVNISSMAAVDPFTGFSLYGASKAWLELLTRALASEGESHGIGVFAIRPGAVETPLLRSLFPDFPADQTTAPEAIAQLVWDLLQPESRHRSGESVPVN